MNFWRGLKPQFFSTIKEKNVNFSSLVLQHFPDRLDRLLNLSTRNNGCKAYCIITNAMELNVDNLSPSLLS